MTKHEDMFQAIEGVVEELRELETDDARPGRLFTIRRRLQAAQNEFIKQGDRVLISKQFEIQCIECKQIQINEDNYYLHLRQQHKYTDEDAASETSNPRHNYDLGIFELRKLLTEYTDTLLEETNSA